MKRLILIIAVFLWVNPLFAQNELNAKLPVDPQVRTGTLPNGMKYYVRKNSKPENRAEFRLAVNAGSTSESDDQQGLAHFVEHMAFNGTKNFKKSEIVDYLESVGTKFGAHLNAYTSFDETVYMLQLPTDKPEIVEKGLQILEDWAVNLLFDSVEVEKERGVVVEEWRLGQGADERMRRKYWPIVFRDSRYAVRLPIGKKEIIEGCRHERLVTFYKDWYRPDLMALVAVGDFDPVKMEETIIRQFSDIPAVKNPKPVGVYNIPDNNEILVATATDKEAAYTVVQAFYKQPREIYRTVEDYRRNIAQNLFTSMLNARLNELQREADPPFMYSSVGYGDLVRTTFAFQSFAVCREDGIERALQTLVGEIERVRRFGFTESELKRQKEEARSNIEKAYNERNKTESRNFAREYVSNYLSEEPIPGIEFERSVYQKYLDGISLAEINAFAGKWISTDGKNCVVIVTAPEKESTKMPTDERIKEIMTKAATLDLKAYVDAVVDQPLITATLPGSKVVKNNRVEEFNITELTLGNGVRIVLKPTDFKNDEILFTSYSWGGWSLYPEKDHWSATYADKVVDESGVGAFNANAMEKLLAGKIVSMTPFISELQQGMNGSCAPKDLETLMQLIYTYFTDPRKDPEAFASVMEKQKGVLKNRNSDPQSVFMDSVVFYMSGSNPRFRPPSAELLNNVDHDRLFSIYKERFSDASGFTFVFVGNFNTDSIRIMAEKYLGSLPSSNKNEKWQNINATYPKGKFEKTIRKGIEPKAVVVMRFNHPFEFNRNNRNEVNALLKLVNIRLREVMREDKSGVYGVSCFASPKNYPSQNLELTIFFGCSPDNVNLLVESALKVIDEVKTQGCEEKNLVKIKETAIREREINLKENQFWLNTISSSYQNNEKITELNQYNTWVNKLTTVDLKNFANKYLKSENYAKFVLMPEK